MKKYSLYLILGILVAGLAACAPGEEPIQEQPPAIDETQLAFFDNLREFCGERFAGFASYPTEGEHALVGNELRTYVSQCSDDFVRIELYREAGDYWHGAWVVEKRDEGLHLFHDHLGEVRTLEDLGEDDYHGYGGFATTEGTDVRQFFAADQVTAEMIPAAETNVWMMELDADNELFIYYLERHQAPRFRAELSRQ